MRAFIHTNRHYFCFFCCRYRLVIPPPYTFHCKSNGCHSVANAMKMSLVQRTSRYLQPSHGRCEPLPAAAALLDPASAGQLLSLADREDLVEAAKAFIKDMSQSQLLEPTVPMNLAQGENDENQPSTSHDSAEDAEAAPPPVKRAKFRYLAQKVGNLPVPGPHTTDRELDEYLTAVRQGVLALDSAFTFWQVKRKR